MKCLFFFFALHVHISVKKRLIWDTWNKAGCRRETPALPLSPNMAAQSSNSSPAPFPLVPKKCWVAGGLGCSDGSYVAKSHRREEEEGEENLHKKVWIPFAQSSTDSNLFYSLEQKGGISSLFYFLLDLEAHGPVGGINWCVRCWWRSSPQSVIHGKYCLPACLHPFLCFRLYIALY